MNVNLVKILSQSVVVAVLGTTLSACAFNPATNTDSPLAPQIDALVAENSEYPRWQDFPDAPVNVPPPSQVRTAVAALQSDQQGLARQVSSLEWMEEDAEQYAAEVRQRLDADGVEAPTANTPAEIEAFAASLRARAKAPPPVDRPIR